MLLSRGRRLVPSDIALAALAGADPLHVYRRPRVAIAVTGNELVATTREAGPGPAARLQRSDARGALPGARRRGHRAPAGRRRGRRRAAPLRAGGGRRGRPHHERRRLGGRPRPAARRGRALRVRDPLPRRRDPPRQAGGLRPPRRQALVRPAGQPGLDVRVLSRVRPPRPRLPCRAPSPRGPCSCPPSSRARSRSRASARRTPTRSSRSPDGTLRAKPIRSRGSHDLGAYASANALIRVPHGTETSRRGRGRGLPRPRRPALSPPRRKAETHQVGHHEARVARRRRDRLHAVAPAGEGAARARSRLLARAPGAREPLPRHPLRRAAATTSRRSTSAATARAGAATPSAPRSTTTSRPSSTSSSARERSTSASRSSASRWEARSPRRRWRVRPDLPCRALAMISSPADLRAPAPEAVEGSARSSSCSASTP